MILLPLLAALVIDTTTHATNINFGGANNAISVAVSDAGANELVLMLPRVNVGTTPNLSAPTCSGGSLSWTVVGSKLTSDNGGMIWACCAQAASQLSATTLTAGWTGDNTSAASLTVVTFTGADTSCGVFHSNANGGTTAPNALTISNAINPTGSAAASYIYMVGMDYDAAWGTSNSTVDTASTVVIGGASGSTLTIPDASWVQRSTNTVANGSATYDRHSSTTQFPSTAGHEISIAVEIPTAPAASTGLPPGVSRRKGGQGR